MELYDNFKNLYIQGHYQQSNKKIHRMKENIWKSHLIRDSYPDYIEIS